MAEKEFLLANKSRELLKYTKHKTKIVSDDISRRDARAIFHKIAQLDDIRQVRAVCEEAVQIIDRSGKEGFTKANFRLYGDDMRQIAKSIMRGVRAANNVNCNTEYETRLCKINDVLDDCSLLLDYIQICLEDKIIDLKTSGIWTQKVTDVKYMAAAWKKKTQELARKAEAEKKSAEESRIEMIVRKALEAVLRKVLGR